jgi:diaminopimelate decarboxylase
MNHFQYRDGALHCEDVPLSEIAARHGTPTYVYSHATLTRHFQVFDQALAGLDHLICFAVKANSNLGVLALLFELGAGADIVSGGELARVIAAGGDPGKVVFSGVGKTVVEMRQALEAGIMAFNVESEGELEVLDRVAGEMGRRAPVTLRVNPDVDAQTHPYISTGLEKNKFGIPAERAFDVYRRAAAMANLEVVGVDCHIGSQLTKAAPFADAAGRLVELVERLLDEGIELRHIDVGGGLGIPYGAEAEPEPPSPAEYGAVVAEALAPLATRNLTLICEPGRVIAGNAGTLITEVLYRKRSSVKEFVVVDAAFNDLLRPAFYNSYHPIRPVLEDSARPRITADVVGPICETGDFLARDRELADLRPGELVAIGAAGAYGFTMASNYNTRPRAAEVMVKGDQVAVVRRRETVEELLALESVPSWK